MSAFTIILSNETSNTVFRLTNARLTHGVFGGNGSEVPPDIVPPGVGVSWRSESVGIVMETIGSATYATNSGVIVIRWRTAGAFAGNALEVTVPDPFNMKHGDVPVDLDPVVRIIVRDKLIFGPGLILP